MSEWLELFTRILLVLNPFAAIAIWGSLAAPLAAAERSRLGLLAGIAGLVALSLAVLCAGAMLDALDVSTPTWQLGASLLLIFGVLPAFVRRDPYAREPYGSGSSARLWSAARMALNLATPATLAALIFYSAGWGKVDALSALLVAGAVITGGLLAADRIERRVGRWPAREAGRVLSALIVLLAVGMAIDGINSV
ncbi:MAG: hypothetical protein DCC58_15565 [Chloroflexi bacterium]|nr:MAG: hypothetical protein DCC58_15565 [Chloroflexota bacterium]